jgi:plastocyanin
MVLLCMTEGSGPPQTVRTTVESQMRHSRLIAQVVLIAGLAVLAFPASGSALSAVFITLAPSGPTPAAVDIPAGTYPVWRNVDTVTHTVAFAKGLCSFQVAPGAIGQCAGVGLAVGSHPYTVDGTVQASINVTPEGRTVTLGAPRHEIKRGARLTLHGLLKYGYAGPPVFRGSRTSMRVTVLARHDRREPFRAVASVRPGALRASGYPWRREIHPRRTTTYIVEAVSQPASGQYWQHAHSEPFTVIVRR